MLKKLELKDFKAHQQLSLEFNEKSILLFGENGSGKTSIFEALRIIFFNEKMEPKKKDFSAEEEYNEKVKEFYREYNRHKSKNDFDIIVNDFNWRKIDRKSFRVFMISIDNLKKNERELCLDELIKDISFDLPEKIHEKYPEIINNANKRLIEFKENIILSLDLEGNFVQISDEEKDLKNIRQIRKYFNEAKINLVILSLLFSIVEAAQAKEKTNILVLDDIATSLDMANKTFLFTDILQSFNSFQKLILTHSVIFFNLIMFLLDVRISDGSSKWRFVNLYEIDERHVLYDKDFRYSVDDLKKEFDTEKLKTTPDLVAIGNKIRQKFERLVFEFSKIVMLGGVEESDRIIQRVANRKEIYLLKNGNSIKDSSDLVDEILILSSVEEIKKKIDDYKIKDLIALQETLCQLKLYRKVTMHPLSHGKPGVQTFNLKEINISILLIEKLENSIKHLIHGKMEE